MTLAAYAPAAARRPSSSPLRSLVLRSSAHLRQTSRIEITFIPSTLLLIIGKLYEERLLRGLHEAASSCCKLSPIAFIARRPAQVQRTRQFV
jgi:hypothetical protein